MILWLVVQTVLRFDEDFFDWCNTITIDGLSNVFEIYFLACKKLLSKKKGQKTLMEVSTGSHLANRKWTCYLKNWDSSGGNYHLQCITFLKSSETIPWQKVDRSTPFSVSCSFLLKTPKCFAVDAILFLVNWYLQLGLKWRKTKLFVFIMHSKSNHG